MSNDAIDLIRRLPELRYAAALAALTPAESLPDGYAQRVHRAATNVRDQLAAAISNADLPAAKHAKACEAFGILSNSAEKRARIDIAGRALMAVPSGDDALTLDRKELIKANFDASAAHIHAEANAARELLQLLHDLAA